MSDSLAAYMLTPDPDQIFKRETSEYIPRGHYKWDQYEEWVGEGNEPDPYVPTVF